MELWELGCSAKLARLIVYLSESRPISPPLVKPVDDGEVILQGGHHRYAIEKVINEKEIPIHIEPEYKSKIDERLSVRWANA
jgi:ParB-like chromosome segregation protein Spo0J